MSRLFASLAFGGAASRAFHETAAAASVVPLNLPGLSAHADRIVVGRVEAIESHFITPESRFVVTDVTMRTEQCLYGSKTSLFVVGYFGGAVGRVGQLIYGEATYRIGERVIVFAVERSGVFYALGKSRGVLHVYEDEAGISRVASSPQPGVVDDVIRDVGSYVAHRADSASRVRTVGVVEGPSATPTKVVAVRPLGGVVKKPRLVRERFARGYRRAFAPLARD